MSAVDKSSKLIFHEFQRSISEVPLEVFYQTVTADQYNSSGFQFNIKQPGSRALLDTDIWICYRIPLAETVADALKNIYENARVNHIPQSNTRIAFRGGNVIWRALQNFNVQINNQTLNVQPYRYVDILNRLYVSNDQSEHEFTTSGGPFDSGNHSLRTEHIRWAQRDTVAVADANRVANGYAIANGGPAANNTRIGPVLYDSWNIYPGAGAPYNRVAATDLLADMLPDWPLHYEFYNPGFSARFNKFTMLIRDVCAAANISSSGGLAFTSREGPVGGLDGVANTNLYSLYVYERLPISLFKMYSNDAVFGVIPNVVQMQIQGNFVTNFAQNILRANLADPSIGVRFDALNPVSSDCEIYLRWYTPPMNMSIPRELEIPYPKIVTWSTAVTIVAPAPGQLSLGGTTSHWNITLESIPDLLLIYIKYDPTYYTMIMPDDYLMELESVQIAIDSASGKMNQMHNLDLYNKWKKILKHSDSRITGFEEWRKYCCVAALQPEDYGVRYGPGYSNQTTLGVQINYRNWWNIPSIMLAASELYAGVQGQLIVTSIYNRNRLIIRADGTASQEMTKVSADFNVINSIEAANSVMESRGRLNL